MFVLHLFFECAPFWFAIVCFNLGLNCYNFTMTCFKGLMFYPFSDFLFFLSQILAKGPHRVHYPRKTSIKFFSSVKTIYLQKMAYLALCWQRLTKTASIVFQLKTVLYEPCTFWRKGLKPGVLSVSHHSLLQHHKGMVFRRAPLRVHFLTKKLDVRNELLSFLGSSWNISGIK